MKLSIRNLYEEILEFKGENIFDELLMPWISKSNYSEFLDSVKLNFSQPIEVKPSNEMSWELYGLLRVFDILTLSFQVDNKKDGSDWTGPRISLKEYEHVVTSLGCQIIAPNSFDSFHCEIIEARENESNYELIETLFPAVVLGDLLIKKAGVIAGFNSNDYDLTRINNSKIYWAFRRKNRAYHDLSHGWGHNSQWRTEFRFDVETEDSFIYNLYGDKNLLELNEDLEAELDEQNLSLEEAIELTKNRHFICVEKDDEDLFPYCFKYVEQKNTK